MNATTIEQRPSTGRRPVPRWFWIASALGLAWNAYGIQQFAGTVSATPEKMMAMGMTASQAALYASLPGWMTAAFAIGVLGGAAGSTLLLLRRKLATPVLLASLAGYLVLYAGDIIEGVFAALGFPQVAILTAVVLIAAALLWLSWHFQRQGGIA